MAALSDNLTCSLMRGNSNPLPKINGSTSFSVTYSFEPSMLYNVKRSKCSVHARAAKQSGQLSHSLRTDESLGTAVRKSWPRQQFSKRLVCSAMDASMGGSDPVFPRMNVRDPYKRLGINREAGEEEVREARSYLASQYSGDAKSMESIESAYDKIMMEKLREYQKLQSNPIKKKEAKPLPAWMQKIVNMYQVPNKDVILKRAAFYALLAIWTVVKPGDGGPAFQVLMSFLGCIYFLNDRIKKPFRSFFIGFGALVLGWVFSSFLVPVIPTKILPSSWTLELTSSLISYIFLWAGCTFLR
ncbi:hypothetical protein M758_12G047100 [Ceratodon purpureus]|uniref:Protein CHAPERONE-LIKE PROTEIN OF POR1, chloroplastic n=1 Tax=Ceratodon purpureus TaxID=3225 RepID=A0A8T0G4L7_CERPU|nr:hypothetical protein KC19_12G044500 [Ceratodon purpureus]KAG0598110.1 hypothetical protein M758_12G047100 [Ceratodon purpureus]